MSRASTVPNGQPDVGRNAQCPCGSGKRYKHCHGAAAALGVEAVDALVRRGLDAHRDDRIDAAEGNYRAALSAVPEHPLALHYLGVVLYQRQQLGNALPLLARAAALAPHEPEFHNNHGLALADAGRVPEAIDAYRRALALQPAHPLAWNNLGLALQLAGSLDAAVDAFYRALALQPNFAQAHWNLALALLLLGRYDEAWPEYAWRLRTAELATQLRDYPGPRWTGGDPGGRTLLLTAEQGLGDVLQNLRFARELAQRGARVVVVVHEPLVRLAATAPGVTSAWSVDDLPPAFDAHVSLMSLPGLLKVTTRTIPAPVPYLRTEPLLAAQAHTLLAAFPAGPRNVGLAWAGAAANRYNTRRACPLASLAPLFGVAGFRWFSLQRDGEGLDADDAEQATRLIALDLRNDFDGTAALVDALDLVISVDTSLAHLAGALAKPVWILLPFAPDWRWLLDRDDTPWYPTARLFRQRAAGDWSTPVDAMCEALRREVSQA